MDCYPPCNVCTGLCHAQKPVPSPRAGRVASIPRKHGTTELICGHKVPADEITLTVLGDGLGAQPLCERCGDFFPIKRKKKKVKTTLPEVPLF